MEKERPCVGVLYQNMINALGQGFYYDWSALFEDDKLEEAAPANARKKPPADYTGLGAVVLNALMCRPWWKEDELAESLRLPLKPVRRILRLLETHAILAREHRKQKKRKRERAGHQQEEDEENDVVQENDDQGTVISYSSIDYQRTFDVTRLKIFKMRQKLKAELEDKRSVQEFKCPSCSPPRIYTTLHIKELIRPDGTLRCSECETEVVPNNEDESVRGLTRMQRKQKIEERQVQRDQIIKFFLRQQLLEKVKAAVDDALRPLSTILAQIEQLAKQGEDIPDFGSLNQWIAQEAARLPSSQDTRQNGNAANVVMRLRGDEDTKEDAGPSQAPRELPPWLRAQNNGAGQSSSQSAFGGNTSFTDALLKEDLDVKQAKEDEEALREFKKNIAAVKVDDLDIKLDNKSTAGGWEEVGLVGAEQQAPDQPVVKTEQGTNVQNADGAAVDPADEDDEWEDA